MLKWSGLTLSSFSPSDAKTDAWTLATFGVVVAVVPERVDVAGRVAVVRRSGMFVRESAQSALRLGGATPRLAAEALLVIVLVSTLG